MYTGVLHKSYNCKFRYPDLRTFRINLEIVIQPVTKTIFLQGQIRFYKFKFLFNLYQIISPVHILSLHDRQFFDHICRLVFFLQKASHADTFQGIKQKMRIDLALQCQ